MADVILENQVVRVNNIFCIGRNYVDHVAELKNEASAEPVVFMKPNNSILLNGETIQLPSYSDSVHYECELTLLIGQDLDADWSGDDLSAISGYGVGLDLTARDVQTYLKEKQLPWTKGKGFRGAACMSDFIASSKIANPQQTEFTLKLNGQLRQHGHTDHMVYSLTAILKELATSYGLRAGDVIFTGTPAGVGKLHSGDELVLDLAGLVQAKFKVA
ncbi:MAG: fumarylacetoacetate hydrolase family protein [Neisseria sp.]